MEINLCHSHTAPHQIAAHIKRLHVRTWVLSFQNEIRLMSLEKISKILFLFLILSGSAFGQKNTNTPKPDLKAIARENVDATTKRLCVSRFTDPEGARALAPFATVSQMCECARIETSYMVTDELAEKLVLAQLDQETGKYMSKAAAYQTFEEFGSKYNAAVRSCSEQFMSRRR